MKKLLFLGLFIFSFLFTPSFVSAAVNLSFVSNTACYMSRSLTNAVNNCYDTDLRVRYRVKNSGSTSGIAIVYTFDKMGTQIKGGWTSYFFPVNAYSYIDKSMSVRGVFCKGVDLRLVPGFYKNPATDYVSSWQIDNSKIYRCY
jgi:hypothetical protein